MSLDARQRYPVRSTTRELVPLPGRFFPNGVAAPVAADSPDRVEAAWSVSLHPSPGRYRIQMTEGGVPKFVGLQVSVAKAAALAPGVEFTWREVAHNDRAGWIDIEVYEAGVAVDYAADPDTFFRIVVWVRNTGVNP